MIEMEISSSTEEGDEIILYGVEKTQQLKAVIPSNAKVLFFCFVFLSSLLLALESTTSYLFLPYITSDFNHHSLMSTVAIVNMLLNTVTQAPIAKFADVFGRVETLTLAVIFIVIGYICTTQCQNIETYIASQIFYILGSKAISLIIQILLAELTSLHSRVLASVLPSTPFIISAFVAPYLGQYLLLGPGWRIGVGIWAVLVPLSISPLLFLLWKYQRRGKRPGVIESYTSDASTTPRNKQKLLNGPQFTRETCSTSKSSRFEWISQLDLLGSLLFLLGLGLLLIPLTLTRSVSNGWQNRGIIGCLVTGGVVSIGFFVYDAMIAASPIVSFSVLRTRVVAMASLAGVFQMATYYLFDLYLTSYYQVVRFASPSYANLANNVFSVSSTVCAILTGLLIKRVRKMRIFLRIGATIFLAGMVTMCAVVSRNGSISLTIVAMGIYATGSGFYMTTAQACVQSFCDKNSLGPMTAFFLTCTALGGSLGSAISGAVWQSVLRSNLASRLPADHLNLLDDIIDDLNVALSFEEGSEARIAINASYQRALTVLTFIGVGSASLFWLCSLAVKCKTLDGNDINSTSELADNEFGDVHLVKAEKTTLTTHVDQHSSPV